MKNKFSWKTFAKNFKRDWQLHLLILFPVVYLVIFDFIPMYGLQIAFRDFRPRTGITGSEWVGLKWFESFLSNYEFGSIFLNTLIISLYSMATFPLPIIFALVLNALRSEKYSKVVKTVSYMPHFISTVVMVGILNMLLSPTSGMYGNLYRLFGGSGYPTDIRYLSNTFRHLYIWSGVWQSLGWSSIIYVAALSGVSQELHEAAQIDGASRLKRIWHIDIPAIAPTIAIMLIMRCTSIISVGFEKVYLMQNALNLSVSEVISTYVFKVGLSSFRNYSYGAAVGLFNTAINLTLLVTVNSIVKKSTDGEISLY
jgi:putative aldouronate transport system permease protein